MEDDDNRVEVHVLGSEVDQKGVLSGQVGEGYGFLVYFLVQVAEVLTRRVLGNLTITTR